MRLARATDSLRGWTETVDALYHAVGDEAAFSEALGQLRVHFEAQRVSILRIPDLHRTEAVQLAACDVPAEMFLDYQTHYVAHDVWIEAASRRQLVRTGAVLRGSALVSKEELQRSRFWREYLRRYDQADMLAGVLEAPERGGGALTLVTFMRGIEPGPFSLEGERRLTELLPELQRVIRLHAELARIVAIGTTLSALYRDLVFPLGFVDAEGRLVHANCSAIVELDAGLLLRRGASGSIERYTPSGWRSVAELFGLLKRDPSVEVLIASPHGPAAVLGLRDCHLGPSELAGPTAPDAAAMLTLRPLHLRTDAHHLMRHFGLTPREIELAHGLDAGLSPEQLAGRHGLSIHTVRTHLAALLEKTNCTRQVEAVAKLKGRARSEGSSVA